MATGSPKRVRMQLIGNAQQRSGTEKIDTSLAASARLLLSMMVPLKKYCPCPDPVTFPDGTQYCYKCNTTSDETEQMSAITAAPTTSGTSPALSMLDSRRLAPFRASRDQAQLSHDSPRRIFFDREHAKSNDPSTAIPDWSTLYEENYMDLVDSSEDTDQDTDTDAQPPAPSPEVDASTSETKEHEINPPKMVSNAKFRKFMDLARELRERIYAFALDTGRPIKPHLCDYPAYGAIHFHDDNQDGHFAISNLLGITRVNKETRNEALPIFYSANTFEVGPDTSTYFDRLAYLGRFEMIRNVQVSIGMRKESTSPGLLRRMNQYIKEADVFEKRLTEPVGRRLWSLKHHPQYTYGGIPELNTLIVLMKLTSPLVDKGKGKSKADTTAHSKLVVPVPSASAFASFDRLKWFPAVMYDLGIHIHYVENTPFSSVPGSTVDITWRQRFQKKDFSDIPEYVDPVDSTGQTAAYKRALELDPALETKCRPRGWAYLRTTCAGGISKWFDIATEGGGISYRL
ncbi:hypothetical protein ACET3X_009686 [Alternaria dauci]|uniref:2EXR domain-containing protein n=1 Tax=Alternaria dauci TaxID=48095 RepID=A0ABR3U6J9_9PLEO